MTVVIYQNVSGKETTWGIGYRRCSHVFSILSDWSFTENIIQIQARQNVQKKYPKNVYLLAMCPGQ